MQTKTTVPGNEHVSAKRIIGPCVNVYKRSHNAQPSCQSHTIFSDLLGEDRDCIVFFSSSFCWQSVTLKYQEETWHILSHVLDACRGRINNTVLLTVHTIWQNNLKIVHYFNTAKGFGGFLIEVGNRIYCRFTSNLSQFLSDRMRNKNTGWKN